MKLIDILVRELPKRGGWPDGADFAVQNYRDGGIKFGKKPIEIAISEKWNYELWQGEWHFSNQYDFICHEVSTDCREAIISRGDYEAALAASKAELDSKELPAIIGRFVPIGNNTCGRMPFNVLTMVASDYMPPAWEGIREGGKKYHVIERAWRFEPVEWNGEGLPPVGLVCEGQFPRHPGNSFEWQECLVLYAFDRECAVKSKVTSTLHYCDDFRPIRSEADKKRDEAIKAMASAPKPCGHPIVGVCSEIYDAIAAGKIPGIRVE